MMFLNSLKKETHKKEEKSQLKKDIGKWYQDLLNHTVKTSPDHALKFAVIVTYPDPTILALYPEDFVPDKKGKSNVYSTDICKLKIWNWCKARKHACLKGLLHVCYCFTE